MSEIQNLRLEVLGQAISGGNVWWWKVWGENNVPIPMWDFLISALHDQTLNTKTNRNNKQPTFS